MEWAPFIAAYGVWLVAAFIALETIGAPLPAEAALIAAAVYAATTETLDIRWLLAVASLAAIADGHGARPRVDRPDSMVACMCS